MTEALKAATEDTDFQFILAKLFGSPQKVPRNGKELYGWAWRGKFYVVKIINIDTPDSQL